MPVHVVFAYIDPHSLPGRVRQSGRDFFCSDGGFCSGTFMQILHKRITLNYGKYV